jgi:hypothetical protein
MNITRQAKPFLSCKYGYEGGPVQEEINEFGKTEFSYFFFTDNNGV